MIPNKNQFKDHWRLVNEKQQQSEMPQSLIVIGEKKPDLFSQTWQKSQEFTWNYLGAKLNEITLNHV